MADLTRSTRNRVGGRFKPAWRWGRGFTKAWNAGAFGTPPTDRILHVARTMKIDLQKGRVEGAQFSPSPNFDARPEGVPTSLLVVHGISLPPGQFGGPWVEDLFCGCLDPNAHPYFLKIKDLRVSTHLLVRRDASLMQFVSLNERAWHAGESCFEGRRRCNDFSIGIELEGADEIPYEDAQYRTLAALAEALMMAYPDITPERIVGHCHISPGRKTDPGPAFDWERLHGLVRPAP